MISRDTTDPVQIICGLEILGLSKVAQSLKRISETGNLPGAGEDKIVVEEATSKSQLQRIVDKTRPETGSRKILLYESDDPIEAKNLLDRLASLKAILNNDIRPVIILSASHSELRALAIRRGGQSQFLSPWGAEMIRVHLDVCERPNLDTREIRNAILDATGGIPSEITALVNAMMNSERPVEEAANWKVKARLPDDFMNGAVAEALWILNEDGDFNTKNEFLRDAANTDFETIGPDLQATGLAVLRHHEKGKQYRLSALGRLIASSVKV